MEHPLIEFLSRYIEVSPELHKSLFKSSLFKEFPRGTVLLRQGEPVRFGYFVLKGCVRSYVLKNGEEKTLDFYTEEDPILPVGYGREEPATHYLVCVEDTSAVVNSVEQEERLMREYPELASVCLTLGEAISEKLKETLERVQTSNAEERYLYLVENRPDLLQRVPQYQIAGYVGVKPESLSRIRRRLVRQKSSK